MSFSTPDPSPEEIALTITGAGELKTSVKNINQHAKDALKGAHSEIVGTIPAMKFYNDPVGHPEVMDDPLYDKYVLLRRQYAATYLAGIIGKNANMVKGRLESLNMQLQKMKEDYINLNLSGDSGIEGDTSTLIATASSSKKTFPNNPDALRFIPETMRRGRSHGQGFPI